ncbi:MAG TPA: HAD family phosphatase [Allosphingosinicella sp.]
MRFDAVIFDFDGVLIESEYAGNRHLAELLTGLGHPTTTEEALTHFMGLGGSDFLAAVEAWIERPVPDEFHSLRGDEDERVLREGVGAVEGAVELIRSLPPELPKAIASSSSVAWIERHLEHLGLCGMFGDKLFSGREHVERGKPAPDLYLHAAKALGVDIRRTAVIEDSPVGVRGAVASGAHVVGLCAGSHCMPGHAQKLRSLGAHDVAMSFEDVARILA